jgi:hypothetical protein
MVCSTEDCTRESALLTRRVIELRIFLFEEFLMFDLPGRASRRPSPPRQEGNPSVLRGLTLNPHSDQQMADMPLNVLGGMNEQT